MNRFAAAEMFFVGLSVLQPAMSQLEEERFISVQVGQYTSDAAGSSIVIGGGYYVRMIDHVLLSADVDLKYVTATIAGVKGNEVTWIDVSANARYLFRAKEVFTPYIGIGFGYGPLTVNDGKLRGYGISLEGGTTAFAILGIAGIRFDTNSGILLQAEGRYISSSFKIEGAINERCSLTGLEILGGIQFRL